MNKEVVILQDGHFLGTWLANKLGLHRAYFSKLRTSNHIMNKDVKIEKFSGIVFVCVPDDIKHYIKNGYIANKIEPDDDVSQYDYIFELTKDARVGFWK